MDFVPGIQGVTSDILPGRFPPLDLCRLTIRSHRHRIGESGILCNWPAEEIQRRESPPGTNVKVLPPGPSSHHHGGHKSQPLG